MTITQSFVRPVLKKVGSRALSSKAGSFSPIPVDIEHYTSGWKIEDLSDFTRQGEGRHCKLWNIQVGACNILILVAFGISKANTVCKPTIKFRPR